MTDFEGESMSDFAEPAEAAELEQAQTLQDVATILATVLPRSTYWRVLHSVEREENWEFTDRQAATHKLLTEALRDRANLLHGIDAAERIADRSNSKR